MQFKQLEWKDIISDSVIVTSNCKLKVYGYDIKMEFCINYEPKENVYYLYSFGQGSVRRGVSEKFNTAEEAKSAAFEIYNKEMCRMKMAIDSFMVKENT